MSNLKKHVKNDKSERSEQSNYNDKTDSQKLKLRKKIIRESLKSTAQLLHHTPAVCKSSYIYKNMITCLEEDEDMFNNINYKSEELLKKMLDRKK